ncbi:hypothetical protein FWG95_00770 [Candidatus Saccharibacteria bacterium]|nr:hypothetical protein [Candidatus Saccharibacteria bacterium]
MKRLLYYVLGKKRQVNQKKSSGGTMHIKAARRLSTGLMSIAVAVGAFVAALPLLTANAAAPTVLSVTPSGTGAALSGNVVITFSEAIDTGVTGTVQLNALTPLSGGSWDATDTVYTIPYSGLSYSTAYTVNISGFEDVATNTTMTADSSNSFTTMAAPTPVITINTQPTPTTTVTEGSITGSLSVAASVTESATLSYQWYENGSASNVGGTAIPTETGASFTIPTTLTSAGSPYYYYVVVSATGGATSVPSDPATVNVDAVPTYLVTVDSAGTGATGSGSFAAGDVVSIDAGTPPAGKQFKEWTSSVPVVFADATSPTTTFVMPAGGVTITAVFEDVATTPPVGGGGIGAPSAGIFSSAAGRATVISIAGALMAVGSVAFLGRKKISQLFKR